MLRLFGGTAIGAALFNLGTDNVEAACKKVGAKCDKKRRCCKGTTCKRGKCGLQCGDRFICAGGFCARAFGGAGTEAGELNNPTGVATDGEDRIHVADTLNHRGQVFSPDGGFVQQFGGLGTGSGQFDNPFSLAATDIGDIHVVELANHRDQQLIKRRYDPANVFRGNINIAPASAAVNPARHW